MKKSLLSSALIMAMGAGSAQAVQIQDIMGTGPGTFSTDSANFTMLQAKGASLLDSARYSSLHAGQLQL